MLLCYKQMHEHHHEAGSFTTIGENMTGTSMSTEYVASEHSVSHHSGLILPFALTEIIDQDTNMETLRAC